MFFFEKIMYLCPKTYLNPQIIMKHLILMTIILLSATVSAQTDNNPKDLWSHSVDVTPGNDWMKKSISVPGKGEPNVIDFFRALTKAYPCEYHDLLLKAIDGDNEVLFHHEKPYIVIDSDTCLLENESFSMRVFYENDKPVAVGVCFHKALTTKLQDAYYYRYDKAKRKLTPLAKGSDFTGGIIKRQTIFHSGRRYNEATMSHGTGRCSLESQLVWENGKFVLNDNTKQDFKPRQSRIGVRSLLHEFLMKNEIELREPREPQPGPPKPGSTYNSLAVCTAVTSKESSKYYVEASAIVGFYYFHARGWEKADGSLLVAIYTECAPELDYDWKPGETIKTPHKLEAGDEVCLNFYLCDNSGHIIYQDPSSPTFEATIGKGMPDLMHNEWRCAIGPDNESLVFVSQTDEQTKVFKWDRTMFKEE